MEPQGGGTMPGTQGWPQYRGDTVEAEDELHPGDTLFSTSAAFPDKWRSGHERRGEVVALRSCDMVEAEYWLRRCRADRWMTLPVMDVQQLFTAATLVT